ERYTLEHASEDQFSIALLAQPHLLCPIPNPYFDTLVHHIPPVLTTHLSLPPRNMGVE
ncbi:hypothetical protein B0O80DRAFT_444793, partial [Mortierella sp. GBAus27b]